MEADSAGPRQAPSLSRRVVQIFRLQCLMLLHFAVYSYILLESASSYAIRLLRRRLSPPPKAEDSRRDSSKKKPAPEIPPPDAVAVVLAQGPEEPLHFPQLALICDWCCSAGVQNLIFYDAHGNVHTQWDMLMEEVLCRSGCKVQDKAKPGTDSGQKSDDLAQPRFGVRVAGRGRHQCKVYTAQGSDSYEPFVKAARDISGWAPWSHSNNKKALNPVQAAEASRSALQEALGKQGMPTAVLEPQLVMVFGKVLTVAGYPPWALRLSEVHGMGLLKNVSQSALKATFDRYCRTEQRFGR